MIDLEPKCLFDRDFVATVCHRFEENEFLATQINIDKTAVTKCSLVVSTIGLTIVAFECSLARKKCRIHCHFIFFMNFYCVEIAMRNDRVTVETLSGKNSPQKNEFHSKTAFFDLFA